MLTRREMMRLTVGTFVAAVVPVRETPPHVQRLNTALANCGGPRRVVVKVPCRWAKSAPTAVWKVNDHYESVIHFSTV